MMKRLLFLLPLFLPAKIYGIFLAFFLLCSVMPLIAQTSKTGRITEGTLADRPTCPGPASIGDIYNATDQVPTVITKCDSTGWSPVGGASPLGNNGDLQMRNGALLAASGENDNGTTLAVNRDQQSSGPNPHFDIRAFGGFIANSPGTMTCTINSGSATLNCTSNPDFKDATGIPGSSLGHGIVIPGAGTTPTIITPGTPTITPNLLNGATTWNYKVIAEDYKGGLTAATAAGTTATGQAALGATTFTISSVTRVSGTSTYTTSSAHNLQPGMTVLICKFGGGASCPFASSDNFNGTKVVQTTPLSTTFTTLDGDVPDGSESPGNAQGNVLSCNTLSYAAGSYSGIGTLRYWIYRSLGAGAYSLVGVAQGLDPYFVDCGVPAPPTPSYVPALPPGSAQAGYLATTISSGGGTNTLTLATNAGTTATSVTVVHDNGPNLIAAVNAAAAQTGGTVYIPSFPNNAGTTIFWQFNSLADLSTTSSTNSNMVTIKLAGNIFLVQPWNLRSNLLIEGVTKRNATFMYPGGAWVASTAAPTFFINANSVTLRNLFISQSGTSATQVSGIFTDNTSNGAGPTGITIENVGIGGNNASGYMRPMVFKGGFDYALRQVTCDGSLSATQLPFPCIEFTNSSVATFNGASQVPGRVVMRDSYLIGSGIAVDNVNTIASASGTIYNLNGFTYESGYTPFLRIGPMGNTTGYNLVDINVSDLVTASGTPVVDASGSQLNLISMTDGTVSGGIPPMVITSWPQAALILNHPPSPNRGSVPAVAFNQYNSETDNLPFNARGTGRFIYQMAVPGAPSGCVVSAGGAVPIGTVNYSLSAVDADGNETTVGPVATVVTSSGNQTVTCNLPSRPTGAVGFMAYHGFGVGVFGGNKVFVSSCVTPQFTGSTFVDSVNSTCGTGQVATQAGSSILSSGGLASPSLRLVNGGIWTLTPSALTVNRAVAAPNLAGALGITTGSFTNLHGACFDLTGADSHLIDCGYIPFANPMTTAGDTIIGGASGVATRVPAPTSPSGIPQTYTLTPPATAETWAIPGVAIDSQTGTSYPIPATDDVHFLTAANTSPIAWTGPTLANNYVFTGLNLRPGLLTFTPASGTMNPLTGPGTGTATQIIPTGWFFHHYTNNTDTFMPVMPTIAAFPSCADSGGNHLNFTSATGAISCGTSSSGAAGIPYGSGAGSVNVMTVTTSPAVATNAAGTIVGVLPNLANTTTTPTLNVGGAGAQTIKKQGSSGALIAVQAGDYNIVSIAYFVSDGTVWQLLNPQLGQLGTQTYVDTTGNLQCLTNVSCSIGTTNSIQQTNSNLFVAGNSFRGPALNGGATAQNVLVQGGIDSSATSGVTESGLIARGGDETGATGANIGGYAVFRGGMVTSAAGSMGVGSSGNGYFAGATVTQWNIQHITASFTVQDAGANAADGIGVATNAATPVYVVQNGNVPINASAAVTIGHTVCTGATAGKVTDSGGVAACTLGTSVGVVIATSGTFTVGSGATTASVALSTTLPLIALKMD